MKIKKHHFLSLMFFALLVLFSSFGAFASEGKNRLIDNAKLLNSLEFDSLSSKLDEISDRQKMDIVILTEKSLDGRAPQDYADDYFDYNGYGLGEDKSGILLLLNMEGRDWHISTKGYAITVFTDMGLDYISKKFLPDLKSKDYKDAFETFANLCDEFITEANTDKPYDSGNLPKEPLGIFWIPGALLIGVFAAWYTMMYMKKQLKTAEQKTKADDYIQKNSLQIKNARDIFLYSNIIRHARPKSNSGSSTHRSSSGSLHGGRGGKF